jgi:type I restriction enzyme S subunit
VNAVLQIEAGKAQSRDWPTVPLGEIVDVLDSKRKPITKRDRTAGPYPYYGATGVLDWVEGFLFDEPLVLVGEDGAKWGAGDKSAFPISGKTWVNNHAHALRPHRDKVIDDWLVHFLNATDLSDFISGMTVPKLNQGQLREIPIPIAPLEEQKRIVALLDQAFAALDRARAHAEANLAGANALFENFLSSALANDSPAWELATFDDTSLLRIIDGDRGKNYPNKEDFGSSNDCLFLNTKNVRPDGFEFSELMFISREKDEALSKGKLDKRDVVLTTRGTVGNVGIFDDTVPFDDIRINSGMLILRPNEERLRAEYLVALIRSKAFKDQIAHHVSGAAQPQLPIRSLRQFSLPMPKNVSEQLMIATDLEKLEEKCVALKSNYRATVADLANLRQSLLQKAFSGQLT